MSRRERRHRPYVPQRGLQVPGADSIEEVMEVLTEKFKLSNSEAADIREMLKSLGFRCSANVPCGETPSGHNLPLDLDFQRLDEFYDDDVSQANTSRRGCYKFLRRFRCFKGED